MRYLLMTLLMFGFTSHVLADKSACLEKLTYNYSVDSRSFQVNTDHVTVDGHENDHLAQARSVIRSVLELNGCNGRADINFGWSPLGRTVNNCQQIVRNKEESQICYVETNLGYFFVTQDFQTTIHVIFSRWD